MRSVSPLSGWGFLWETVCVEPTRSESHSHHNQLLPLKSLWSLIRNCTQSWRRRAVECIYVYSIHAWIRWMCPTGFDGLKRCISSSTRMCDGWTSVDAHSLLQIFSDFFYCQKNRVIGWAFLCALLWTSLKLIPSQIIFFIPRFFCAHCFIPQISSSASNKPLPYQRYMHRKKAETCK